MEPLCHLRTNSPAHKEGHPVRLKLDKPTKMWARMQKDGEVLLWGGPRKPVLPGTIERVLVTVTRVPKRKRK